MTAATSRTLAGATAPSSRTVASGAVVADPRPAPFAGTVPQYMFGGGQSLIQGTSGSPALTTSNTYGAPQPVRDSNMLALVEASVEQPITAGVFQIRDSDSTREYIGGQVGNPGTAIADIRGPSATWTNIENRLDSVDSNRPTAVLSIVPWVHGHADAQSAEGYYRAQLALIQAEYTTEAQARLTGQGSVECVMALLQGTNVTNPLTTQDFSHVPYEMFEAWRANKDKFILVGPMYQFSNVAVDHLNADGTHMDNTGYRLAAELWGEAVRQTCVDANPWDPLYITSAVVSGSNIIITYSEDFDVDTTACIAAPAYGDTLWGIHLEDAGPQPEVITSISKTASNQLTAVCSGTPHTGAEIWTGKISYRGCSGGPGIAVGSERSMRTNIRKTASDGTGVESTDPIYKWAALQREAVTGATATVVASNGTVTLDRRWTCAWAGQDSNPAASSAWTAFVGGVDLPYRGGTSTLNQSTTGLNDNALGTSLVDEGFDNTGQMDFQLTDLGDLANTFDKPANHRWLMRFIGETQRPGATAYVFHQGIFSGTRIVILFLSNGNISVQTETSEGARTFAAAAALPATSTLGMVDIVLEHDEQDRLMCEIYVNGTAYTQTPSAFSWGAVTGLTANILSASNGSAGWDTSLICFLGFAIGHDAYWWTPEIAVSDHAALIAP